LKALFQFLLAVCIVQQAIESTMVSTAMHVLGFLCSRQLWASLMPLGARVFVMSQWSVIMGKNGSS